MSDYLLNTTEVIFANIFRKCDLRSQQNLFRAYDKEEFCPGIDRVSCHRMEVTCWCCMIEIFYEMFCHKGGRRNFGHLQTANRFAQEPALLTPGFDVLYKFVVEYDDKKYFVRRDLKNPKDMKKPDEIFEEFQTGVGNLKLRYPLPQFG